MKLQRRQWDVVSEKNRLEAHCVQNIHRKKLSNITMISWKLTVLWVVTLCNCDNDSEWKRVRIAQGEVRGRRDPGGGLYTFYNIPYATVPVGADKFKAPLPGPVRSEPLNAVDKGIICMQVPPAHMDLESKSMQEDCLVANVYVPDTENKDLPVMVYIHGGGFEIGYGNMMTPKHLVKEKRVIVVTFNYRLGVHGFLCLGTEDAPGNAGMKDQVALLHWVKINIGNFGGNPNEVTIVGGSAGSISAHLLMISPTTKGLFNKVILESGVGVSPAGAQLDPLKSAKEYAKMLNFTNVNDFHALKEFYKNTPLKSLIRYTYVHRKDASLFFSPCIERKTGIQVFLDDSPINIIKNGKYRKVPILIGINDMEGLIHLPNFETWKNGMNENFYDFIPADLQFESEKEKEAIIEKVKEFYFGSQPVGENTILAYIDYHGDTLFIYPTLKMVKLHVETGHDQIYLYEYNFVEECTPVVPFTNIRGATHGAQTVAVLDGDTFEIDEDLNITQEYKQMKGAIRELWFNFVVHGKPVPESSSLPAWPTSRADSSPYMSLGKTVELRGTLLEKRARLWDDIYLNHYRQPIPPLHPASLSNADL